jgi:hypothetical protein
VSRDRGEIINPPNTQAPCCTGPCPPRTSSTRASPRHYAHVVRSPPRLVTPNHALPHLPSSAAIINSTTLFPRPKPQRMAARGPSNTTGFTRSEKQTTAFNFRDVSPHVATGNRRDKGRVMGRKKGAAAAPRHVTSQEAVAAFQEKAARRGSRAPGVSVHLVRWQISSQWFNTINVCVCARALSRESAVSPHE